MTAFSQILREEVTRAGVFTLFFLVFLAGGLALWLSAASPDGGALGRAVNLILTGNANGSGSLNWSAPGDGTVYNAQKLGNHTATEFLYISGSTSCPAWQAIYKIDNAGQIFCR